jgi:photosystem II stability/assembly factor-like uncharacterized protein
MNERMSDDELIERLRRTLDTEAARIDAPEDAWERFQAAAPPPAPQHHRNRRLWLGAPSAVVGLAAAILIAVLVTHGSAGHPTQVATPEVRGAASATTSVPSAGPAAAAGGPEAASAPSTVTSPLAPTAGGAEAHLAPGAFSPRSVTFVSPSEGWVLGNTGIEHTVDGGRTWSPVGAAPSSDATHLRFADPSDGWAWSSSTVWSTHDGGRTWTRQTLPGLATEFTVEDLQASAGVAHVAVTQDDGSVRILTTPVGSDAWRLSPAHITLGAGPVPSGQLVLQGSVGWFIQVDRTVVAGARLVNGQWQPWTPPCLNANGPAVLAASSPTELVAACDQGVWGPAAPMGEQLSVSHDGGATWTDAGGVPAQPAQAVASASSATIVAAGTGGLEATFDAGRSWATVVPVNGNEVTDLGFTTATQGVAVVNGHGPAGVLLMTRDGGHTWNPVTFP